MFACLPGSRGVHTSARNPVGDGRDEVAESPGAGGDGALAFGAAFGREPQAPVLWRGLIWTATGTA